MAKEKHEAIPEDMYKEHIMELYKAPSNFGILRNPTNESTEYNTVCGDEITIQLIVKKGIVKDIKFHGSGCVISLVASSLLTDKIRGMTVDSIKKIMKDDLLKMLQIKITPARIKCALLPLEAAKKALE